MIRPIAIIAGEPNSISSEIIFKAWKLRQKYKLKKFILIGSIKLLQSQKKTLKFSLPLQEISSNFKTKDLKKSKLFVINVDFYQKKSFEKISKKSNKYIFNCFKLAANLIKQKKISSIINCPVSKETLFKGKNIGITEYLGKKFGNKDNEVMLIYNKNLSVSPLTTHIPIKNISKKIKKKDIINKLKIISNFYKRRLNKLPKIAVLALNPHSHSNSKFSEEKKIIFPAIKELKKLNINVIGPISPDTSFMNYKKNKIDVIFGMYHDQVLTGLKALYDFDAINITLGLPFIRISPDHGTAFNIVGKKTANPKSLISSIRFLSKLNT